MPAAGLPVAARAVEVLLAVGHPEALRVQVPVVRAFPEPAAAAPVAAVEADGTLEPLTVAATVVQAVAAVVQVEGAEAADVPANQPKSLFPVLRIFHRSSLQPSPSLISAPAPVTSRPSFPVISRRRARQRGSALLLVMWLISMLSLLIYSTIRVISHDMDITISQKKAFRARQLAEMGLNIACNPVVKETDTALLNQIMGDGESFNVTIRGEGGRFNVNSLLQANDRTFFERAFELWGLEKDAASYLTDTLLDWTDQDEQKQLHGMEKEDYEALGYTGYPFDRPFYSLDEMLLVPGFDQVAANVPDWRDYFTIYSGGKLDLNAAEAKVIALGIITSQSTADPVNDWEPALKDATNFIQDIRWGPDDIEFTEDDVKLQDLQQAYDALNLDGSDPDVQAHFGLNDATVHIESVATVNDYRKRVVLIVRNRTQGSPQILAREEVPLFQ